MSYKNIDTYMKIGEKINFYSYVALKVISFIFCFITLSLCTVFCFLILESTSEIYKKIDNIEIYLSSKDDNYNSIVEKAKKAKEEKFETSIAHPYGSYNGKFNS